MSKVEPRFRARPSYPRLLICAILFTALSAQAQRIVQPIDTEWSFRRDVDKNWHQVDLPHDWSILGDYDKNNPAGGRQAYLPCGLGYYTKALDIPPDWIGKHIEIEFDAAYMNSVVSINGHQLGKRPYGFISFAYDLTPFAHAGSNVLEVTLDNSKLPSARWYTGSGIYSHVRLVVTNPTHIAKWGVFATSTDLRTVKIGTKIEGDAKDLRLSNALYTREGSILKVGSVESTVDSARTCQQTFTVNDAKPWSPEHPTFYTLVTKLYSADKLLDETKTNFAFRTIKWDANTGFWLNGQNIKLKGVCMHWDQVPFGAAIPDRFIEARIKMLKDMGCNAIRTSHDPFPPYFYDACDRLGMMVMDECFDGWHKKADHDYGQQAFAQWWKRDLTDFVTRDRNHPCVIIWSIGNETGKSDIFGMTPIVHSLDPSRLVTGARMTDGIDVAGFNGEGEAPGFLQKFHEKHPNQPIVLTEQPHTYQTRGYYRAVTFWRDRNNDRFPFPPYATNEIFTEESDKQYCSSYDNNTARITARSCWKRTKETPWISGEFRWISFDYLGEAATYGRHWPLRFADQGIIDPAMFPKDVYYFYQSQWTSKPMIHLLPDWTHPDMKPGTIVPVVAYSNCDEIELFLNGKSLGKKQSRDLADFVWDVPYEKGELYAVGYRNGVRALDARMATADEPNHLTLEVDPNLGTATVTLVDHWGRLIPRDDRRVFFAVLGKSKLLGLENGDPEDVEPHYQPNRRTFHGLLRAFFDPGEGEVIAATWINKDQISWQRASLGGPMKHVYIEANISEGHGRITRDGKVVLDLSP